MHAAALDARREALEHLGEHAQHFGAAIERYVNAVEVADAARRAWEADGRPLIAYHKNGTQGVDPRLQIVESNDRAASRYGAALGLDPFSARKLGRVGTPGRPLGAASAPDRRMPGEPAVVTLRAVPQSEPSRWSRLGRVDPDDV